MVQRTIQRSFSGGVVSSELRARADIPWYASSCVECENFIVTPRGTLFSRPGTKFIDEIKVSASRARLIPFKFSSSQSYVLVFENLNMRVIKDGGYVLSASVPYDLVTPYTTAQLSRLIFVQDADVMTIVHPSHDPKKLVRLADDNWTLTTISYASSVTAPTGVGISSVGTSSGAATKNYRYVVTAVKDGVESLPSAEVASAVAALSTTWGLRISWTAVSGADYYRVYRDPSDGTGVYAWVGDTETLLFDDYNVSPDTSDAPPFDYLPFASADDKPATVGYFQQRQIFANTNNGPHRVFATQTANYESMRYSRPARATDAIFFTLKSLTVEEIRHIIGLDSLLFLTENTEYLLTEGQERVLTPFTVGFRPQSYWGANWTRPVVIGDTAIYIQETGSKFRDIYAESASRYTGDDLSFLSYELFQDHTFDEMDYAKEPDGILWAVRDDGALLGLTYKREYQLKAWHSHTTPGGEFESIAVIREGGRDAVYTIVKRTVDGSTVRYIERFQPIVLTSAADTWCLDCALNYTGAAATTISGLDHLEGEEVVAVADGNVVEGLTVTGGEVELPTAAENVTVGIAYTSAVELLDIDLNSAVETLKGRDITVVSVMLEVHKSRGGWVGVRGDSGDLSTMYEIKPRFDSDGYAALALKSFKQEVGAQPGWSKSAAVRIEQRSPMPLNILSVVTAIDVS